MCEFSVEWVWLTPNTAEHRKAQDYTFEALHRVEESTARHSSPRAWVIAVIQVPDAFAPLPTQGELGMNIDAKSGLPSCMRRLSPQTTSLQILNLAEVGNTASADHLLQMAAMPLEHKTTALGIPYSRPVAYHFDGAEALQQSLFSLFALLITGDSISHCAELKAVQSCPH